jgi:hypothetical protein
VAPAPAEAQPVSEHPDETEGGGDAPEVVEQAA